MKTHHFIAVFSGFVSMVSIACFPWLTENLRLPADLRRAKPLVRIRFVNRTGLDLEQITVGQRQFRALSNGAVSGYHYFAGVYVDDEPTSMFVEARTKDRPMGQLIGCGNTPGHYLSAGDYTCTLIPFDPKSPETLDTRVQRD